MNNKTHSPQRILIPDGIGYIPVFRCANAADVDNQSDVPPWALAVASLPPIEHGMLFASRYTLTVLRRLQDQFGRDAFLLTFRSLILEMEHGFKPKSPVGMFISRLRTFGSDGGEGIRVQEV